VVAMIFQHVFCVASQAQMRIKMLEKVGVLHNFVATIDQPFCSSLS
jgi:hypothetical protein